MNLLFAKSILYSYSNMGDVCEQIDELVVKRALSSIADTSPALDQYERIINFTEQKKVIIKLYLIVTDILKKLSKDELDLLDYKYFKKRDKSYYNGFDNSSRTYFRRQIKIAKKFSELLEKRGVNDKFFITKCLPINFYKELLIRVKEKEELSVKNKPKKYTHQIVDDMTGNISVSSADLSKKDKSVSIA